MPALPWIAPLDENGCVPSVRCIHSPNRDERPDGSGVDLVVVHAISLPPDQFGGPGVEQLFTNQLDPDEHSYYAGIAQLRVSAHFFIRRDGSLLQFVPVTQRAWHAGVSSWKGRQRCNDFSIGIELEGCDTQPFRAEQYGSLSGLLLRIRQRYPQVEICGHSDIAPGRKTDPGPFFEWERLRALLATQAG
jgi:N-acetyl-anhydromuramoyl-L-alanine amidase